MAQSASEKVKTAVLRSVCRPYSPVGVDGYIAFHTQALAEELKLSVEAVHRALEELVDDDVLIPGAEGHYLAMPNMAYAKTMIAQQLEQQVQPILDRMRKAEAQAARMEAESAKLLRLKNGKSRKRSGSRVVH